MNGIVLQTLRDFSIELYRPIFNRDLDLGSPLAPKAGNLVKVVVGMRRSGKSYRLLQEMEAVHASGIPWDRICYFDFEDERLAPVTPRTGDEVLEAFFFLHPDALEQGCYLFFDEVQEMEGWGAWLRRIVDTHRVTIYVSGSSSKMLSTEIATEFRGRALDFELLPFSFREYARYHGAEGLADRTFSTAQRLRLQEMFSSYLERGGFPAAQELPSVQAIPLLQSYAQRVVARDVVERHNVGRPRVASLFAQRALGLNGRQLSLRKAVNDLRSAGVATSRELLGDLLGYFEEAYLLFQVREFSLSLSEAGASTPKLYAIDPGLALANGRAGTNDEGQRLENAVYLELRRRLFGMRRDSISALRTRTHGYEIDFAAGDAPGGEALELYQVAARVDDQKTLMRETRALWEAMDERGLEHGTLVVGHGSREVHEKDGKRIEQVPAWEWFVTG